VNVSEGRSHEGRALSGYDKIDRRRASKGGRERGMREGTRAAAFATRHPPMRVRSDAVKEMYRQAKSVGQVCAAGVCAVKKMQRYGGMQSGARASARAGKKRMASARCGGYKLYAWKWRSGRGQVVERRRRKRQAGASGVYEKRRRCAVCGALRKPMQWRKRAVAWCRAETIHGAAGW